MGEIKRALPASVDTIPRAAAGPTLHAVIFDLGGTLADTGCDGHRESGRVPARPGILALVDGLMRTGVRIAVVSTGRRAWVEPLVNRALGPRVAEVVVTGDDVARRKPDPAAHLLALRRLRLMPEHALAIEGSAVGLRAARLAGLATIVVTNGHTAGQEFNGAALVLSRFDGPDGLSATRCFAEHRRWYARHKRW